uniref:Uncharacterized protein n=1 Tax=Human herpesvirus 2 TaxID=10310 RepID=A0A481TN04_HHV2|nr:hypothetical protein [Human alphaherpesvirus 2]
MTWGPGGTTAWGPWVSRRWFRTPWTCLPRGWPLR